MQHGKTHTRREQSPIHNGTHSGPVGMNKNSLHETMDSGQKSNTPKNNHERTQHRIVMSHTTLHLALKEAYKENQPEQAIETLVNYVRKSEVPFSSEELTCLRTDLNRARAFGGKLSPDEEKLMILFLY